MIYPKCIVKNESIIGVTATSAGFENEIDIKKLECAIKNFEKLGYKIKETKNVRKSDGFGQSSSKKIRAEEFLKIYNDNTVSAVILAKGGDFLFEILEYINFDELKKLPPKLVQGYSDSTFLTYILTTMFDISTIYSYNFSSYGMKDMDKSLINSVSILEGKDIIQESFDKFESSYIEENLENVLNGFNLTEKVYWKNLHDEEKIEMNGRIIGGCFDIILEIVGTKFDYTKEFIEKYKTDGIIWYLESYDLSNEDIIRGLTKLKYAGYFKYTKGIIFGRPVKNESCYGITYEEAIKRVTDELNIPVIYDACIGHRVPQFTVINGSIAHIECENGKGSISFKKI